MALPAGPPPTTGNQQFPGMPPGITQARLAFAERVRQGTGLDLGVILAWILAENGPNGNPLNIGPGRNYGSPQAAAAATVSLLHAPIYAPVIASAKSSPAAQIAAIVKSPWDAGHYAGAGGHTPGALLRGTYARVRAALHDPLTGALGAAAGAVTGAPGAVAGAVSSATGWLGGEAAKVATFSLLTLFGLVLVTLGLLEVFGFTPRDFTPAGALRAPSSSDRYSQRNDAEGIPF